MVIATIVAGAGCLVITFIAFCCCVVSGRAEKMTEEKEDLDV